MRVLLSNDDGVHSAGLAALAAAFGDDEVWIVAPDREQSASSHAISLHRPLRLTEVGPRRWAVDGTPTDAVYMGLNHVLKGARPDVVVSGVNHGPNLANDVLYSGTVAAAMEAALLGVHAIAVSLAGVAYWIATVPNPRFGVIYLLPIALAPTARVRPATTEGPGGNCGRVGRISAGGSSRKLTIRRSRDRYRFMSSSQLPGSPAADR